MITLTERREERARLTRQQGCGRSHLELPLLPHEIERRGILGNEIKYSVSLAMWSHAEEIGSEVRHTDLQFLILLPFTK